jgi:hypothetical protein
MNVKQPDGSWKEANPEIVSTEEGAAAVNAQHRVLFAANLNTEGAIRLVMADGKQLRSHVLCLAYQDSASGKSAVIAEVTDSTGQLLPPNQVIYTNAFEGVNADVRYTLAGDPGSVVDCQFIHCTTALASAYGGHDLKNVLFADCNYAFAFTEENESNWYGHQ